MLQPNNTFNSGTLVINEKVIDVLPVLTEGQATQGQPASDLTPDYLCYQQTYQRIASLLGSRAPLDAAVQSGDVRGLQQQITTGECPIFRGDFMQSSEAAELGSSGDPEE